MPIGIGHSAARMLFEHTQHAQHALTSHPVLVMPDYWKPSEAVSNASVTGNGAVLLQDSRPVAYDSRKVTSAAINYTTGEQELLGVVHAMRSWLFDLEGVEFTMVGDHNPLTYLHTQPTLSRRQFRWSECLQTIEFRWGNTPVRAMVADSVSRVYIAPVAALTRSKAAKPAVPENPNPAVAVQEHLSHFQVQVQEDYKHEPSCNHNLKPAGQSKCHQEQGLVVQ